MSTTGTNFQFGHHFYLFSLVLSVVESFVVDTVGSISL